MIKILVDTSSDFSPEEAKEKGMFLVPLTITFDDISYQDRWELNPDEFYQKLTGSEVFPKTSQPTPQAFLECFQAAKANGDEVICVLLSSALSGTCQSALLAKNMVDYDKIYLVDSLSATHAIRILVEYTQKLISEGRLSAAEIAEELNQLKSRIRIAAGVDTLEYLCRGGRVSRTAATIGELANLKPIITVSPEGTVTVLTKCIGRNKAISWVVRYLQEHDADRSFPMYSVYTLGTDNAERFEKKLEQAGYPVSGRHQIGSTIGTHVGPGVFGIIYIAR